MTVKTVQAVGIRLQIGKLAEQMLLFQLVSNSLSQKMLRSLKSVILICSEVCKKYTWLIKFNRPPQLFLFICPTDIAVYYHLWQRKSVSNCNFLTPTVFTRFSLLQPPSKSETWHAFS